MLLYVLTSCTAMQCKPDIIDYEVNEVYINEVMDRYVNTDFSVNSFNVTGESLFETFVPGVSCRF